jgi:ornithine cyclodeaminase/alanine dehydrogenase-like protein (mu-crystallin family)
MTEDVLLLSKTDIEKIGITYAQTIDEIESVFLAEVAGEVQMAKKTSLRFPEREAGFINSMPAYLRNKDIAGIKWVSGFQEATRRGLPFIIGTIILNDSHTGAPVCIMDGTLLTEMRTATVSTVGAKYLARKDSETLGIIGCGAMGKAHLLSMAVPFKFARAYCYDVFEEKTAAFIREMEKKVAFPILKSTSLQEVLSRSDILCTCTVPREPFLDIQHVTKGAFAASVEGRQAWLDGSYTSFDKFCVDEWSSIIDGAHMKSLCDRGVVDQSRVHADLKDVVSRRKVGRERPDERILLVTRGLGMEDIAMASKVYAMALEKGAGTRFNFL